MSRRPCLDCGTLCAGSRCTSCGRARDRRRGSAAARGYDAAWRRLRTEHLALEPDCACGCGQVATDVDHIVPRRLGGSDDHANLQSLAHGHHSRKTVLHDGGFGHFARIGISETPQTMASSLARAERFRDSGRCRR
jgi:5-methylcytosine-specific restriction protein A